MTAISRALTLLLTGFLLFQLIGIYLSWPQQMILGAATILLGLAINKLSASRVVTLALMLISITATLRYGWWRVRLLIDYFSDQSNDRGLTDTTFMLLLISAEAYTVVIMILGYMQTAWPLRRKPIAMPADVSQWPHVDVLIPTYNEPLPLVRYTALAAINMDYPQEKLHVYILDDGTREDFFEFSKEAGVGYIIRKEHTHAKAGNINHALTKMNSPFVAIFDCDHVPTRSFLQMNMGWMLADAKLAMLQTPHHFYSTDPFERNLLKYKTIPNEGELFYGIVQDGNDFWNATFFCGSCSLLRRSTLDEVGGIATETVTEDAHTSLRMQKKGYNTAYINIPQAAGLATETLAAHVGQRIRWARGMIQILRTDNPLFGGRMKFTQRLCYFSAMVHFLYAVPRLVFLGAPLVYLLLGRTIIPGYWVAILVYAFPHLILASLTNSRVQGRHRHSFWNEIYETVLAPYILAPTLLALINPKLGKFNVTDKGSTLAQTRFDRRISAPTRWMLGLNFAGLVATPFRLATTTPEHHGAIYMNMAWVIFNMVILGVAAAVAHEQMQRRTSVRIDVRIPLRIELPDGRKINAMSVDMSVGGASVRIEQDAAFAIDDVVKVAFPEQSGDGVIDAKVVGIRDTELRLEFSLPTIPEQEVVTRALYSRADAWLAGQELKEIDRPLVSLGRVFRLSLYGIYQVLRDWLPSRTSPEKSASVSTTALLVLALGAGALASSQISAASTATRATAPADKTATGAAIQVNSGQNDSGQPTSALQTVTFKQMGLAQPAEMHGPHSYYSLHFTLSHSLVPRHAALQLVYSANTGLDAHTATLAIQINGIAVTTLPLSPASGSTSIPASPLRGGFVASSVPIPDSLLVRNNVLTFEFTGGSESQQVAQTREHVYVLISPVSSLDVGGDRLSWGNNLSQLPLPIFDGELQTPTTVPFVFLSAPSAKTLQTAGILASWLGIQAGPEPVHFRAFLDPTASVDQIPQGNAILLSSNPSLLPAALEIPPGAGSLIALRVNPNDAFGSVLVLAAQDEDHLLNIARSLSLTKAATATTAAEGLVLSGDTVTVPNLAMPRARTNDDAPRWLPISRATPLASCRNPDALSSDGSSPVPLYFHLPPDLYYGEVQNLEMTVHYRYNAFQVATGSALRVKVNGALVSEIPLPPGRTMAEGQRTILVPVADLRPFGNTALFNFDFTPANRQTAPDSPFASLKGEIQCNSTIDLHGLLQWRTMPDLEVFANAGFPFTRLADLSETTVVLPASPSPDEIALFLHMMGHFGEQTGYPVLRVTVAGPSTVIGGKRDYLILGAVQSQPAFGSLASLLPVTFDATGIHIHEPGTYLGKAVYLQDGAARRFERLLGNASTPDLSANLARAPDAMIEEVESPSSPRRSIVLVALGKDESQDNFSQVFLDRSQSTDITDSVSLLAKSVFTSYPMNGTTYHVGDIGQYAVMRIWLTQHFLLLLFVVTALSLLAARWAFGWMANHARERLKLADRNPVADRIALTLGDDE